MWEIFGGKEETSFGGILDWCYYRIALDGFISRECNIREQCGLMESTTFSVLVDHAYGYFFYMLTECFQSANRDSTVQMHPSEHS